MNARMNVMVFGGALLALALLAGCSEDISGTYSDDTGMMTIQFNGGTATMTALGVSRQNVPYKVNGNTVTLTHEGEDLVLTRQEDGTLTGGEMGFVLKRRPS